ncbi:MAG TPA: tetratricopeptide repeat-containing glycosyltransferase family protein [Rhizomicrobium sp.]|jgi:tetratricopeptide (TPR) repeat protein
MTLELAFSLHQQGRLREAEAAYQALLRRDPRDVRALHLLGLLTAQRGELARGADLIMHALRINPDRFLAHRDLGNVLLQSGRFADALASYDNALALKPDQAEILDSRGTALRMLNRLEEAVASHDRALALNPQLVLAHTNRGSALAGLNRFADALESFDRAIALDGTSALAHSNRGNALHKLERFEEALESHDRAVALAPALAHVHLSRGQTLAELGRIHEALEAYDKALSLDPQSAEAQFDRATTLLILGRFREGWQAYEGRRRRVTTDAFHAQGRPQWTGRQDIAGKTLFIEGEQGLGDMIQFCRYARLCADKGAHVILTARESQLRLIESLDPRIEVRPQASPPAEFDYHVPLMSLPLAFNVPEDGFTAATPYLRAEPRRVERWRQRLGSEGLKIGICWQGGPANPARSFPLAALAPIALHRGVRLISLQKGKGSEQLAAASIPVEAPGEGYDAGPDAFLDAAAVIEAVDLVISCDTAIAHLAGALARPVWVALKFAPDWRYMTGRDDSPWYPTMRLFRQQQRGDWQSVFAKMAAALDQL